MQRHAFIFGFSLLLLVPLQMLIGQFHLNTNQLVLGRMLIIMLSGLLPALWVPRFTAGLYAAIPALLVPVLFQLAWSFSGIGYREAGGLVYGMFMIYAVAASVAGLVGVYLGYAAGSIWRQLSKNK